MGECGVEPGRMCIGWEINGEIWPARQGEIMILREMYLEIRRERDSEVYG